MDEQKRPKARKVTATGTGDKVEKKGEGLGTGPVNNTGNYADRKEQAQAGTAAAKPPVQQPAQSSTRPGGSASSFSAQRPAQNSGQRPGAQGPASQRPGQSQSTKGIGSDLLGSMLGGSGHQSSSGSSQSSHSNSSLLGSLLGASSQQSSGNSSHSSSSSGSSSGKGGSSKLLLLLVIAALAIFVLPKLFGGSTNNNNQGSSSGSSIVGSLLSSFIGGNNTSTYDFGGNGSLLSSITGQSTGGTSGMNTATLNREVAPGSRDKYINVSTAKKATVLVYMCGTDLESQSGMATADIKEMLNAGIGDNVNLLIYTGGCAKWRNTMFSKDVNQIYQIEGNAIQCLESNMGTSSMTDPKTLQSFIEYGYKNFKANRMCLILWDHGGGSVSGYGYDEKTGRGHSMTLAGIKTALENSKVKFDFIGFDACLMATVENGLMLSNYADYMIASEETEPGVGWYYTNWLKKLSDKPNIATIDLGKAIADDFVEVCAQQCRGQATTLSVVDLAELGSTLPTELSDFSVEAANMIQNKKEYKTVANARSSTKEFAQSSGIDQIDLYDFANRLKSSESGELKKVIESAVKYNRTGGGISNAHGLSIYFPYKKAGNVKNAVSTYKNIEMDADYTRCIQAFASLEASGQVSATGSGYSSYYGGGQQQTAVPGLMDSLLGGGSSSSAVYGDDLTSLLGSMLGGGSGSSSLLDLLGDRTITEADASAYVTEYHVDNSLLSWENGRITLPKEQADLITGTALNIFFDDGTGYIDLGMDILGFEYNDDYTVLTPDNDNLGVWVHFNGKPVAFYYMYEAGDGDIVGYIPAKLNDTTRVNLLVYISGETFTGELVGAQIVYPDETPDVEAKTLIGIKKGDKLTFLCDYYDYNMNYRNSYQLGDSITLADSWDISYKNISEREKCLATWCLTDIYNVNHWTQSMKLSAAEN